MTYGTTRQGVQTGRFDFDLWDSSRGLTSGHLTLPNSTTTDMFCNAQIVLPQSGDVLLAGGDVWNGRQTTNDGNDDSLLFSTNGDRLTAGQPMQRRRWYATVTTLPSGATYIQGGKIEQPPNRAAIGNDRPEVREPDGSFRLLVNADNSDLYWWYPRNFVATDGRIFGFSDRSAYFVDPNGKGMVSGLGLLPPGPSGATSSEVMFAPGKILRCGGGARSTGADENGQPIPSSAAAQVIDINDAIPRITATDPMPRPSHWHTAIVGADGRVVVVGGGVGNNTEEGADPTARIWDPNTGEWTVGAASQQGIARLYHSTALLLPDASILVAGGGAPGPQDNLNAEIYYPPYLFDGSSGRAARPAITDAPAQLNVGQSFAVNVTNASAIRRVTLVKTGAVTHSFDMDQRFLELAFSRSGATLQVAAPRDAAQATPGNYLLFVIDENGVPSEGRIVAMRPPADPTIPVDWTPTVGEGTNGALFRRSCPSGTALVGVYGGGGTRIARIGPRCVRIDRNGRWLGTPMNASTLAGSNGVVEFERTCPANMAVSGFRGRSSRGLVSVELACQAVDGEGHRTGVTTYLPKVGGSGGFSHLRFGCTTRNPAFALYGRSSASGVHGFGLRCRQPG